MGSGALGAADPIIRVPVPTLASRVSVRDASIGRKAIFQNPTNLGTSGYHGIAEARLPAVALPASLADWCIQIDELWRPSQTCPANCCNRYSKLKIRVTCLESSTRSS